MDILEVIPEVVTADDNKKSCGIVIEDEANIATFQLGAEKASGPDGFTTLVFQKCWGFMGKEIIGVVEESRRKGVILKELNNTNIDLIPKK